MKRGLLGLLCGLTASIGVGLALPAPFAYAATSCEAYTCEPPTGGTSSSVTPPASEPTTGGVTSPSELAFTGADIAELTVIGAGALLVGSVLLRSSRRRSAA